MPGTSPQKIDYHHVNPIFIKALLVLTAIVPRLLLSYLFFGSADLKSEIIISSALFGKSAFSSVLPYPYVPLVGFFSWFSGILVHNTNLPIGFCFKLIPIIFDTLIVLLIFDFLKGYKYSLAFPSALLYALNPIPLLITCIHFQWDSVVLFFLILALYIRKHIPQSFFTYFLYGTFFALSFLFKPYTAIFLIFFFRPYPMFFKKLARGSKKIKLYIKNNIVSLAGIFFTILAVITGLAVLGYPIIKTIDIILRYANRGNPQFGLPFAHPFSQQPLKTLLNNRVWMLFPITLLAWFFYKKKIPIIPAIIITFSLILSFSGLYTPYLLWIVPFLFLAPVFTIAIIYTGICTPLLLLFLTNPAANHKVFYENMLSFATLKPHGWLTPPEWLTSRNWIPLIRCLSNYIIPFLCLSTTIYLAWKYLLIKTKQKKILRPTRQKPASITFYLFTIFLITGTVFFTIRKYSSQITKESFNQAVQQKMNQYDTKITPLTIEENKKTHPNHLKMFPPNLAPNSSNSSTLNIVTLLFLWTIMWMIAALIVQKKSSL